MTWIDKDPSCGCPRVLGVRIGWIALAAVVLVAVYFLTRKATP